MRRTLLYIIALVLTIAASGQTLNVKVGSITYQFPAAQTGEMTYANGQTVIIMGSLYIFSFFIFISSIFSKYPLLISCHLLRIPLNIFFLRLSRSKSSIILVACMKILCPTYRFGSFQLRYSKGFFPSTSISAYG